MHVPTVSNATVLTPKPLRQYVLIDRRKWFFTLYHISLYKSASVVHEITAFCFCHVHSNIETNSYGVGAFFLNCIIRRYILLNLIHLQFWRQTLHSNALKLTPKIGK